MKHNYRSCDICQTTLTIDDDKDFTDIDGWPVMIDGVSKFNLRIGPPIVPVEKVYPFELTSPQFKLDLCKTHLAAFVGNMSDWVYVEPEIE